MVAGNGSGRTIEARLAASNGAFGAATLTAVVFRNGVQIGEASGSIAGMGSGFALVTVTGVTVAANDVITVQARSTANVTVQAANSWCRVT
ncbi:hypothetical protein [Nocardia cyriacigeorgica]|uniref:hypothetical protein n=1 Tax=Nocardia cyriacigeorgica TaxID=135487 RepID=UPI002453C803|nr:hypothetical protein [Nocardia cyriacigeorgica]